jgi:signal transduction histidine kinase
MLTSLKSKIRSGYFVAFLLLLTSYLLIFQSSWQVRRETDWMIHSYQVLNKIKELSNSLMSAETGLRGYVITKDASFLHTYDSGVKEVPVVYTDLRNLAKDNAAQVSKLDTLKNLLDSRLSMMVKALNSFQNAGQVITPEMESMRERSKQVMDSINIYTVILANEEETIMKERTQKVTGFFDYNELLIFISLITAILAISYSLIVYNRESKEREKANLRSLQYQLELEKNIDELKAITVELQELRSMEKYAATGRITQTIAHEVRNPLTNISLAAEQLQEINTDQKEPALLLAMINRNVLRINHLVADLLNATKSVQLDIQKIDINNLLDETVAMATDRIDLSQVKVEKYYTTTTLQANVDVDKMKVAFLNIIINAIEAMEKNKGVLKLRTFKKDHSCVINIEDNGSGMDPATLQRVFEPYFTNKSKGNGLGLTNVQNIILSHKGKIDVKSNTGQGITFTITLPLSEAK